MNIKFFLVAELLVLFVFLTKEIYLHLIIEIWQCSKKSVNLTYNFPLKRDPLLAF